MLSDIRKFRRNQIILTIVTTFVNVVIVAGIITYYRLKEQGFCGYMFLDNEEMGKKAAEMVMEKINNPEMECRKVILKTIMRKRESTGEKED